MASINAQNVAKEVSENIRKGKKVKLGEIIKRNGYSEQTSKAPQRVTETKSYKEATLPIVEAMMRERNRLLNALSEKNLTREKYRDMVDGFDKLTKNIQLLSGGATERSSVILDPDSEEKLNNAIRAIAN